MKKADTKALKKQYDSGEAWGILTSIDLHKCDPKTIRDANAIKRYVKELCELIEMKRFGDTVVVDFGEDERVAGFSMTQLIETSLISGHFANQSNNTYIDVFSCKFYDPNVVAELTKKFFKAKDFEMHVAIRI